MHSTEQFREKISGKTLGALKSGLPRRMSDRCPVSHKLLSSFWDIFAQFLYSYHCRSPEHLYSFVHFPCGPFASQILLPDGFHPHHADWCEDTLCQILLHLPESIWYRSVFDLIHKWLFIFFQCIISSNAFYHFWQTSSDASVIFGHNLAIQSFPVDQTPDLT